MDATKLDYSLTTPHSSQSSFYSERAMIKNQERQVFFSVSAISSPLEENSYDVARNFGPLSVAQHTDPPYPYPRPCDIVLSPDQHRSPFPQSQEAPLTDVTTYIYDSGSSSYPSNPHPESSYHLSSGQDAFHDNLNEDLSAQSISLNINSLDLAIQPPPSAFSPISSNFSAVRRYHEDQSRQHAQVLHQLTRSRDERQAANDANGNILSASLEITPTGRRAQLYHAASSIPMSNIRPHQPRPPENGSHQLQQSKHFNQYRYPYYHNQDGYQEDYRSAPLDISTTHGVLTQGIRIYESAHQQAATSTVHVSTKTMQALSPRITNSAVTLESNIYAMRPGPRSNAIQSMSQPAHSFEGSTVADKVHTSDSLSDIASIPSPFPVLTNGPDHEGGPSGIQEGINLIEIEAENEDEEKFTTERRPLKEDRTDNVADDFPGTCTKRRDRKQGEASSAIERHRTGDSKSDLVAKNGLSPPTKKRKKSKMHECQVCHKNFPRPSGLKTHMNTHNNERPYSCPHPGCTRSFGVRSNAKRHLRTHGVIPPQSTGTQPYVVDFSTPMVLEQDGRFGLNGEGTDSNMTRKGYDDCPEGVPHTQRSGRPGRGRGRQFKLRWMPPSSSTRSAVHKGKSRQKATDSPSVEPDDDVKPYFSRSPSQRHIFLGHGEGQEREDADAHTDGDEDVEMDFSHEADDDQDDGSEAEEVDRSEEEFGASTAMRAEVELRTGSSCHHSQASSSRSSLSSSLSASASTSTGSVSLPPSTSSSSFTSMSPIPTQTSMLDGIKIVDPNFPKSVPISSSPHFQAPLSASFVPLR